MEVLLLIGLVFLLCWNAVLTIQIENDRTFAESGFKKVAETFAKINEWIEKLDDEDDCDDVFLQNSDVDETTN